MITHLMRADLRRIAPLLVAWVALVAVTTTLDGVLPQIATIRTQELLSIVVALLGVARLLLLVVLVPIVVQLHPLVGSDAFWMTRPIPPLTLLAAKVALLWAIVVIVPTLAQALLMVAFGITPITIALVSVSTMLNETLLLSLLMVAAALTASLARYALLWGGALVALALVLVIELARAMAGPMNQVAGPTRLADLDGSTGLVFTLLTINAAAGLLVVQYRRRSWVRAVLAGVVGVALAFIVTSWWNVPLFARPRPLPAWTADSASARVSADWTTVKLEPDVPIFGQSVESRGVNAALDVETLPSRWSGAPRLNAATLHANDGRVLGDGRRSSNRETMLVASSIGGSLARSARAAVLQTLDVERLTDKPEPLLQVADIMRVTNDQMPGSEPVVGRYQGIFDVMLSEHDVEGVLPLVRGAFHHADDYRLSVRGVQGAAGGVTLVVCESRASSHYTHPRSVDYTFYLRHRERREAVAGYPDEPHGSQLLASLLPGHVSMGYEPNATGFSVRGRILRFPSPYRGRGDTSLLDSRWIAGAELVIVRTTIAGSVERRLEAETFSLPATTPSVSSR